MINIAIIDDGIKCIKQDELLFDLMVDNDGNVLVNCCDIQKKCSHGSYCAKIIKKYCPEVNVGSIKVLETETMRGNIVSLIAALEYCLEKNIHVLHLSIGTVRQNDWTPVKRVIDKLVNSGKIIVAACSNKNTYTVPACLTNVIGVCTRKDLSYDQYEVNKNNCDNIDFIASSRHLFDGQLTPYSNSYAAPLITAQVCNYIISHPKTNLKSIKEHLVINSINYSGVSDLITREDLIIKCPEKLDYYYKTVIWQEDSDNPVISFHNYQIDELLNIKKRFIKKDYNCLVITNLLRENFSDAEYINFSNEEIVKTAIRTLNTFYNPDLLIIGVFSLQEFNVNDYISIDVSYKEGLITGSDGNKILVHSNSTEDIFLKIYDLLK